MKVKAKKRTKRKSGATVVWMLRGPTDMSDVYFYARNPRNVDNECTYLTTLCRTTFKKRFGYIPEPGSTFRVRVTIEAVKEAK